MADKAEIVALKEEGRLLELEGAELRKYVQERLIEREKLVKEKEIEKEKLAMEKEIVKEKLVMEKEIEKEKLAMEKEREKEKLTIDKDKLAMDKEIEKEKLAISKEKLVTDKEIEKEKLAMEKERLAIEKEKLEIKKGKAKDEGTGKKNDVSGNKLAKYKGTMFDENKIDIDIFLKKFEIEMKELAFPEDKWTFLLSKSFAAEVPSKICMNQNNYQIVKEQLLRTFGKTEAFYRQQYVNCTIETNEDPQTFLDKMNSYFDNWTESSKIEKTFDGLKVFLMLDKVIYESQDELKIFLLERKPKSVDEIVKLIRAYKVAHPEKKLNRGSDIEEIVAFNRARETQDSYSNNRRFRYEGQNRFRGQGRSQIDSRQGQYNSYRYQGRYQGNRQGRYDGRRNGRDQSLSLLSSSGSLDCFQTFVGNKAARTIRDTGSTIVGINRKLVEDHEYTGKNKACIMFDGKTVRLPVARVNIKTPYYTGIVEACVIDHDQIDLIIGNIPNIKKCTENEIAVWKNCCGMATTRSCSKDVEELDLAKLFELSTKEKEQDEEQHENTETIEIKDIGFNKEKFITKQKNDPELRQLAKKGGRGGRFYVERGTLVREIEWHGKKVIQFVVPREFRQLVMENGHDIAHTGHLGLHKTKQGIFQNFYWSSISKDIKSNVTSCQLCSRKGARNIKAPLKRVDVPDRPFSKIAIDLIGPMPVVSNRGHRYILTVIDVCSRWPEAIPLKQIEARDIVQALYTLFTRFGFPREILSDRGTQFNCQLATTFLNMFGIQQRFTTSYHPQSTCERFNVNLKKSLYKVMDDKPKEWDMAIPSILFAYRESRNEITGFSPFQMIYGGNPRGPMTILKDLIIPHDHVVTNDSYDIVTETRNQIIKACEETDRQMLERNELTHSRVNEHRIMTELEVGQDVLVLHKDNNNASGTNWLGPYKVARKISDMDYEIDIDSRLKIFHVDLLKEFTPRQRSEERSKDESMTMSACVTEEMETEERFRPIETVATESRQTWKDVMVDGVSLDRAKEIKALIEDYKNFYGFTWKNKYYRT
ncbi:uncharacterized protein LOC106056191 isoform X1 [Biomphalaria glabrata]|uniref:Uncharacterized protein LOC106056191 isoform X1 n=1 Tax=Biomphalaria glabrata TaxID=6526 RepID=A0A9W2YJL5_BIOGL|nr:uncharacterized protein LOC106056191 isoform X1 [Biomphalaria glabrata]XP_055862850.1 uncharacterized protein LOC106056191 isoform X1 [Biomphalaria glabrata]